MKIVGLTGGIGSGKSTVSNYLLKKGYPIIDADKIAREIVEPNSKTLKKLIECFSDEILNYDGSLNRKALAQIAFFNQESKMKLDDIMLEEIVRIIHEQVAFYEKLNNEFVFIDAPLLFEAGLDKVSNEVWVVDTEDEMRIERVVKRDGMTRQEVLARLQKQMSREEKNKRATYILDNSTTQQALYEQIEKLLKIDTDKEKRNG